MGWVRPVNPYVFDIDPRQPYVTVTQAAEAMCITADRVIELVNRGRLRTRNGLVKPAVILDDM
jgi:hypothetical protein